MRGSGRRGQTASGWWGGATQSTEDWRKDEAEGQGLRWSRDLPTQPYYTLSSSSLQKVNGLEFGRYNTKAVNLTLPSLASVDISVDIGVLAYNLTYLDITSLDSAHSITIGPPNLTTLHHTGLRNVTTLYIHPMLIDSLDTLTDNPLNLSQTYIRGLFPNVNNIAIGFTSADYIHIYDNSALTLGGSSTMEMTIKEIFIGGVTDLKRNAQLKTLKIDSIELSGGTPIDHLGIPFDNLRSLKIWRGFEGTRALKSITLPPKAMNWTGGFELDISGAPNLNWTSIYGADDQGNRIQTWYWPKNVSSIYLSGVMIGNAFFDPFVAQQMGPLNSQFPPSVLTYFGVSPSLNSTSFNCTPFVELQSMGRLPNRELTFSCRDSKPPASGAIPGHPAIPFGLVSAVVGIWIWML
ncbi:uncharacterized protein N7487_003471 [Penicillium crustosum]|uniref:uncharacterized protein n=1 Tax=Penicillium crustosum TaxID=36656 RepID=UPI0023A466FD|nr:uncharacterized protein N7487_003471 [Penicillium crustosum]KAJ5419921.1 hypothetical protein N7487_003471 [Penicillium crustosum]